MVGFGAQFAGTLHLSGGGRHHRMGDHRRHGLHLLTKPRVLAISQPRQRPRQHGITKLPQIIHRSVYVSERGRGGGHAVGAQCIAKLQLQGGELTEDVVGRADDPVHATRQFVHRHRCSELRGELSRCHIGARVDLHLHGLRVAIAVDGERHRVDPREHRRCGGPKEAFELADHVVVAGALRPTSGSHRFERRVGGGRSRLSRDRLCGPSATARNRFATSSGIPSQIPRDAIDARLIGHAVYLSHHAVVLVRDGDVDLALRLFLQEIRNQRPRRRVLSGPFLLAEVAVATPAVPPSSRSNVEHRHLCRLRLRELLQRGEIVEDVQAASVRGEEQIVLARMDLYVAHRCDRQVAAQRDPVCPTVPRCPHTRLGTHVKQVPVPGILTHYMYPPGAIRQVAANATPRLPAIGGRVRIWRIVVVLMMVGRHICRADIGVRRLDGRDPRVGLQARNVLEHIAPRPSAVAGDLHIAIVRPNPDRVRVQR